MPVTFAGMTILQIVSLTAGVSSELSWYIMTELYIVLHFVVRSEINCVEYFGHVLLIYFKLGSRREDT